jgi:hypothetical protein
MSRILGVTPTMRSFVSTTLFAMMIAVLFAPGAARAATVSIEPADTTVTAGSTFTLRVVISAFADLKGYQLVHTFDPTHLASLEVRTGDVLTGSGGSYAAFQLPDVTAPTDSTWLDAAALDGSTAGPGVLEYLVFKATAEGLARVDCQHADLRDSQNAWTYPDCAGALVHITSPTPALRGSWGRVKAAYR